jgi:diguanylate cyclase (GGDEF)-like protein
MVPFLGRHTVKLDRLLIFLSVLANNREISGRSKEASLFYFFGEKWWDAERKEVFDPTMIVRLERTLSVNRNWRARNSKVTYFPVPENKCVVRVEFNSSPKKTTRKKIEDEIAICQRRAEDEFAANYDELTQIYNRKKLKAVFLEELTALSKHHNHRASSEVMTNKSCLYITFDIDYFKQINDSHGHAYGDCVLISLARRIEAACKALESENSGRLKIHFGRPGGEEFTVLLIGIIRAEEEFSLAERIRAEIEREILPSNSEWQDLHFSGQTNAIDLPNPSDRRVHVSVGICSTHSIDLRKPVEQSISELMTKADIALYRAKSAGRNRVVRFDDILIQFGRIMECHSDTDVVVLDIGSRVNVRLGQEFHVFHPDFSGNKSFIYSDGRTKKTLGRYPRLPSGRVEIIDVQQDISFARTMERTSPSVFAPGSAVEPVPLGSIDHLISKSRTDFSAAEMATLEQLETLAEGYRSAGEIPIVCILGTHEIDAVVISKGSGYANLVLAELFKIISERSAPGTKVALIEPNVFCVMGRTQQLFSQYPETSARSIIGLIDDIKASRPRLPELSAGLFDPVRWNSERMLGFVGQPSNAFAIKGATYAFESLKSKPRRACYFTPLAADVVLLADREASRYSRLRERYDELEKAGIRTAQGCNAVGISYFMEFQLQNAIKFFEEAISIDNEFVHAFSNLALAHYQLGELSNAARNFVSASRLHSDRKWAPPYAMPRALSYFETYTKGEREVAPTEIAMALQNALRDAPSDASPHERVSALNALSRLKTLPVDAAPAA